MPYDQIGKVLLVAGGAIILLGLIFLLFGRTQFLGRLPGDFSFSNGSFTCAVPIASMLLLSLLLTIIVNVVLRIFNR